MAGGLAIQLQPVNRRRALTRAAAVEDAGLRAALEAAGGAAPLARRLGLHHKSVLAWARIPGERVFAVAEATGVDPVTLRPDLGEAIAAEIVRRRAAEAAIGVVAGAVPAHHRGEVVEGVLVDLWVTMAALRFIANERGLPLARVCRGEARADEAARAQALGLAMVAGRAKATNIAAVVGCARQNVDNAAERYLRARDGDDPEDYIGGANVNGRPAVMEGSRLRAAKGADEGLWAMQQRFETYLTGETLQLERRRA
jgi:DNA-binding transcriptional regulator YdaS (Cro superfamily)